MPRTQSQVLSRPDGRHGRASAGVYEELDAALAEADAAWTLFTKTAAVVDASPDLVILPPAREPVGN